MCLGPDQVLFSAQADQEIIPDPSASILLLDQQTIKLKADPINHQISVLLRYSKCPDSTQAFTGRPNKPVILLKMFFTAAFKNYNCQGDNVPGNMVKYAGKL